MCPNCGEAHEARVCPEPPVAVADRPCWNCGLKGDRSGDCPTKKARQQINKVGQQQLMDVPPPNNAQSIVNRALGAMFIVEDGFKPAPRRHQAPARPMLLHRGFGE